MRLSQAIEALCVATRVDGRSPRTVEGYREKLGYLLRFLGDVDVACITIDDLRRFIASLMDERTLWEGDPHKARRGYLSPYTVQSYVRHVRRLFSWLTDEGHLEINPTRKLRTQRPQDRPVKAISQEAFQALLASTEGDGAIDKRDRALILLLADSGARAGGVCGLRLGDLELDRGVARVREKGKRERLVYFTEPTAKALRAWLQVRPADRGDWLFTGLRPSAHDGMSPDSLRCMLQRRKERAGVTGPCSPHSFRHGFSVSYLMDNGDLSSLSRLLGHSNINVTAEYYARFTPDQLQQKHAAHSPVAQAFREEGKHED